MKTGKPNPPHAPLKPSTSPPEVKPSTSPPEPGDRGAGDEHRALDELDELDERRTPDSLDGVLTEGIPVDVAGRAGADAARSELVELVDGARCRFILPAITRQGRPTALRCKYAAYGGGDFCAGHQRYTGIYAIEASEVPAADALVEPDAGAVDGQ